MSHESAASSLQHIIDSNLPLLKSLHSKLALSPDILDRDVRRIVDACTTEFELLLVEKQKMLEDIRTQVENARRGSCLFVFVASGFMKYQLAFDFGGN